MTLASSEALVSPGNEFKARNTNVMDANVLNNSSVPYLCLTDLEALNR